MQLLSICSPAWHSFSILPVSSPELAPSVPFPLGMLVFLWARELPSGPQAVIPKKWGSGIRGASKLVGAILSFFLTSAPCGRDPP